MQEVTGSIMAVKPHLQMSSQPRSPKKLMLSKDYNESAVHSTLLLGNAALPASGVCSSTEDNTGVNSRHFEGQSPKPASKNNDSSFGFQVGHSVDNNSV